MGVNIKSRRSRMPFDLSDRRTFRFRVMPSPDGSFNAFPDGGLVWKSKKSLDGNQELIDARQEKLDKLGVAKEGVGKASAVLGGVASIAEKSMSLAEIADTSEIEGGIDDLANSDYTSAGSNRSLLSQWNSTKWQKSDYDRHDVRGMSGGEMAGQIGGATIDGAMAGLQAGGPWGAVAGAAVGLGSSLGGMFAGNRKARRKAEELNDAAAAANRDATNAFTQANSQLAQQSFNAQMANLSAYGGAVDRWRALPLAERSKLIGLYVRNGVSDLASMRSHYNAMAYGGEKDGADPEPERGHVAGRPLSPAATLIGGERGRLIDELMYGGRRYDGTGNTDSPRTLQDEYNEYVARVEGVYDRSVRPAASYDTWLRQRQDVYDTGVWRGDKAMNPIDPKDYVMYGNSIIPAAGVTADNGAAETRDLARRYWDARIVDARREYERTGDRRAYDAVINKSVTGMQNDAAHWLKERMFVSPALGYMMPGWNAIMAGENIAETWATPDDPTRSRAANLFGKTARTAVDASVLLGSAAQLSKAGYPGFGAAARWLARPYTFMRKLPRLYRETKIAPKRVGIPYEYLHDEDGKYIGLNPNFNGYVYTSSEPYGWEIKHPQVLGEEIGAEVPELYANGVGLNAETMGARDFTKDYPGGIFNVYNLNDEGKILEVRPPGRYGGTAYRWFALPYDAEEMAETGKIVPLDKTETILNRINGSTFQHQINYDDILVSPLKNKLVRTDDLINAAISNGYEGVEIPSVYDGGFTPFDEGIYRNSENVILGRQGESPYRSLARSVFFPNANIRATGGGDENDAQTPTPAGQSNQPAYEASPLTGQILLDESTMQNYNTEYGYPELNTIDTAASVSAKAVKRRDVKTLADDMFSAGLTPGQVSIYGSKEGKNARLNNLLTRRMRRDEKKAENVRADRERKISGILQSDLPEETKQMLILSEMPDSAIIEQMRAGNPVAGAAAAHNGIEKYGVPIALGITAVPAAMAFGLGAGAPFLVDTVLPTLGAAANWVAGTAPYQTLAATAGSPLLWGSLAVKNAAEKTYRNIRYKEPITWGDVANTGVDMALATLPLEKGLVALGKGYDALKSGVSGFRNAMQLEKAQKSEFINKIIDGLKGKYIKSVGSDASKAAVSYFENMGYKTDDLVRIYNGKATESELKSYAEKIYRDMFDERYNGMRSKAYAIPKEVKEAYQKYLSESDNIATVYYSAIGGNKSPFEHFLSETPGMEKYYDEFVMSRPTWLNYVGDGSSVPFLRRMRYNKTYKSFDEDSMRRIRAFMNETGLPMESVIQILSPEYYRFLKETGTPLNTAVFTQSGEVLPYALARRPAKIGWSGDIPLRTDLLKNYGPVPGAFNVNSPEFDVEFISKALPSNIKKFSTSDLDALINNVQYIGNSYPHAYKIYRGHEEGFLKGAGRANFGTAYGTFNQRTADAYAHRLEAWPKFVGKRHAVTVAGKPFFGDNFLIKDGNWIQARDNLSNHAFYPETIGADDMRVLRDNGFDWFNDFSVESQLVYDNPFYVKNLVGNNGAFSTKSTNWFHDNGGRLRKSVI